MPKGKITMAQLSDSLKYKINNANGSIGLTRCTTLLTANSDRVLIDTTLFNKNVDVLLVFKNTTFLQEIEDYTISEDGKYILSINGGIWEASEEDPVVFNFVIFKAISAVGNHIDGKLLIPNSIDEDKLSQDLIEKIQAGGGGGSINVNKYTKTATSTITEIALEKELTKRDTLLVFSNSVYLEEGDDYKVSDTKNSIVCLEDGGWTASEKSPRVFNFVVLTSVPGSNEIEPGSIDETLLNEELKEKLNKVAMSAIGFEKHTSEITTASTSVPIGAKFNRDTDVLIVFDNSTYLEETEDYTISSDGNSISPIEGEWVASIERPRIFNFIIFKALPTGANKIDGALISNNTILETCLEQGVIDKLNSANNIKTSIGNLEDETLPEELKNKTIIEMVKQNFTNANNGKELITNVVGAPLLATDTFQQQKDKIQTIKNNMANKLIAKGLSASGTETMTNLTNKIANIKTGYTSGDKITLDKFKIIYKANSKAYLRSKSSLINDPVYSVCKAVPTLEKNKVLIHWKDPSSYDEHITIHDISTNRTDSIYPYIARPFYDVYYDFYDNNIYVTYCDRQYKKNYIIKYNFNGAQIFKLETSIVYKQIFIDKMNNNVYACRDDQYDRLTHLDKLDPSTGKLISSSITNDNWSIAAINLIYDNKMYCGKFSKKYNNINNLSEGEQFNYAPSDIDRILYEKEKGIFLIRTKNNELVKYDIHTKSCITYKNITHNFNHIYFNDNNEYAYYIPLKAGTTDDYWLPDGKIVKYSLKEQKEIYMQNVSSPASDSKPYGIYSSTEGEIYLFKKTDGKFGKIIRDEIFEEKEIESIIIN